MASRNCSSASIVRCSRTRVGLAGLTFYATNALKVFHRGRIDDTARFGGEHRLLAYLLGQLAQPVRVALTGGSVSPGIYEVIAVLGRERTLTRLGHAIELISGHL